MVMVIMTMLMVANIVLAIAISVLHAVKLIVVNGYEIFLNFSYSKIVNLVLPKS